MHVKKFPLILCQADLTFLSFNKLNILKLIECWYSLLCENPDVISILDLVPIEYREGNFFLNEAKSYSQSNADIHMSPDTCMSTYELMLSFCSEG